MGITEDGMITRRKSWWCGASRNHSENELVGPAYNADVQPKVGVVK